MLNQQALFPMPQESNSSDDYYTPKWLFDALGIEFDLDVACPAEGPIYTPCKAYYTQETNGLASPWRGNVYMNPPYSNPSLWVHKFIEHEHGIALLPFAKSKWCQSLWNSAASMVYVRAITFERSDMNVISQAPFSLGLWAFGEKNVEALAKIGRVR
jgi:phage N-6-adenine-methyltransferase